MEMMDCYNTKYPKDLGIKWDSRNDTMAVDVNTQGGFEATKRGLLSDISRTFDVLGWINPVILPMKLLMQELWDPKLGWDAPLPEPLRIRHRLWREEIDQLSDSYPGVILTRNLQRKSVSTVFLTPQRKHMGQWCI